jgi:signal transduction histidine kinase
VLALRPNQWPAAGSALITPLIARGLLIGLVFLENESGARYGPEQVEIAQEVASSVAVALQSARLQDAVARHRLELHQLSGDLLTAQEDERKRLSYELHDQMGQIISMINVKLTEAEQGLPAGTQPEVHDKLSEAGHLADRAMAEVRALASDLRPTVLGDLGLIPALRWLVGEFQQSHNIQVLFDAAGMEPRLDEEIESALFRIAQEALTNVSRHARATRVEVLVAANNSAVSLMVADDGRGFSTSEVPLPLSRSGGVGMVAMRERAARLNGYLTVQSAPGMGTTLEVTVPLKREEAIV